MNAVTFSIYFIPYRLQYFVCVIQLEKLLDGIYVDKQDLSNLTFYLLHGSCLTFRITIEEIITDCQFKFALCNNATFELCSRSENSENISSTEICQKLKTVEKSPIV